MTGAPPDGTPTVDIDVQIQEVRRELAMRERVYPRRVADGWLRPEIAASRMLALRAVLHTLVTLGETTAALRMANPPPEAGA